MKLIPIRDKNLKLDGGAMFGVVPKMLWQKKYPADENNRCNWAMRCLLADDGKRRILIDNGIGEGYDEKFIKNFEPNGDLNLRTSLGEHGYTFEDITDIVITHLHFDHVGGSTKWDPEKNRYEPAFPNAVYRISEKQWNLANNPNEREKASFFKEQFIPVRESGQLQLVKEDDTELFPGFRTVQFHGHTDGQMIPFIHYKGRTVVFTADLLAAAAHIPLPWVMGYDTRPLLTIEDKKRFYKEALDGDYVLFFEHDLYNECCTLQMTDKGVRLKDAFTLKEFFT